MASLGRRHFSFARLCETRPGAPKTMTRTIRALGDYDMFTLSRSALLNHSQAVLVVAEAALVSAIIFGSGLALGITIGFF